MKTTPSLEPALLTPTDIALFNASTITTIDIQQPNTQGGGLQFNAGAPAYTFNITGTGSGPSSLVLQGSGVADISGNAPTFVVSGVAGALGTLQFNNASTADDAVIMTNAFGQTVFTDNSTAGLARFITNAGGVVDFSGTTGSAGNNRVTAGSIEGAGTYNLGANTLTVGINGLSTTVSGSINDGGASGGTGASLVKVGDGTLILSGTNTYTGLTAVLGGMLQLGDGGTSGSILGDVFTHTTFAINRSDTYTFGGLIVGDGSFVQMGPGTMILTANNAYLGGTTISAGTLQLGDGGASGSIIGNVVNNGTLAVNRSDTLTLSGVISGTGAFQQNGTGTTILTADNTYGGGTTINAGTLQLGDGGASGSIIGNVINNGTLAVNRSDTLTLSGVISGTGAFAQIGPGTTILTAANSYSGGTILQQGTLQLANDSALGSGALTTLGAAVVSYASGVTIANSIVLNSNNTQLDVAFGFATQAGAISETGGARPLEKIGNGALILTGTNSYTGGTTVSAGTLQLGTSGTQGALAGPITVAALPATLSIVNADVSGITSILNNGLTEFLSGTTAGSIAITNNRTLDFSGNASAANASITTGVDSLTRFFDTSTAGNATIVNNDFVQLTETATTGAATVTNNATFVFFDSSTAGTANFTNTGQLTFQASSSAASAVINNTGGGNSTAANATITNAAGGSIAFFDFASGGNAAIVNNGFFSISGLSSAGTTVGSIGGSGEISLGDKNLTFGSLNTSTEISGVIFGDGGSLTKVGTGTTILSGDNEYTGLTTITQGVLQLGNGGTTGSVAGDIVNNSVLAINRSNAFDYAGVISGTGALNHIGTGTTTLLGHSTYTGTTTVSAGTLLVNGSIVSPAVVNGGTLGGTGQLGSVTVNSGTLSPGNSIGTITINGNLVLGAGAIYRVEVSPTAADRTNVTGSATLAGTAQLVFGPGTYASNSYTILSAAGGRTGTFNTLTTEGLPATLSASLSYTATDVLLVTLKSSIAQLSGLTPNQRAVGAAQDAAFNLGLATIPGLNGLTAAQLPGALDQLSGEVHVSTAGVLADESRYVRDAVLGRLRQASYAGNASMASLSVGGPVAAFADGEFDSALAYGKSPIVTKAPMKAPQAQADVVFWAQGFGAWGRFETDGNAATLRRDLAGFISGVDTRVGGNGRLGVAAGYTGSKNALDGRGSANVETAHIAGYSGWNFGAFNLRAGGAYAFHSINTDRSIAFPGFFDRLTANYDGHTGQVFGEIGYGFAFGNMAIEPFAGAAWVRVKTDAAAERGGLAALNVAGTTFETGYTTLGIRAAGLLPLGNDTVLIPRGALAWQHAFDTITPAGVLAFQTAPVPFVIAGAPIARDSLLAEAGLDLAIGRHATLGVSYTGQYASNVQDHAAKGKFTWRF